MSLLDAQVVPWRPAFPRRHRDPFDMLLAAQAEIEALTLVTVDTKLHGFGIPVLW